jgi:beta-glucosidase
MTVAAQSRTGWWVLALALVGLRGGPTTLRADLPVFRDPSRSREQRVDDLLARMTLAEKASIMENGFPGIPRLGIPKYDWWNEALHGVARAGPATVFPQAIGLAAMWDERLMRTVADAVSTEARAKYAEAVRLGQHERYQGLTFWTPNINIFRDPRWGRGQETYGEDPFLTSRLGVAFVEGLQGDDPRFLKTAACAKHFAVHSGPERLRHDFDVEPDEFDFHNTYLPAFEALVREAQVAGVMTAYNSLYGHPAAVNPVLYDLLYRQWGFSGYVTSDCGAIKDLFTSYKIAGDAAAAEAMAVKAGLCVTCGHEAPALVDAVQRRLIDEHQIDQRLRQLLTILFRLGMFDPPETVPYGKIAFTENDSPAHAALALKAARQSIVLLKNDGTLPLRRERLRRVAVIGPSADSVPALVGNYNGIPTAPVTIVAGLRAALGSSVSVDYVRGFPYVNAAAPSASPEALTAEPAPAEGLAAAVAAAQQADAVIFVAGTTAEFEGEEMKTAYEGFDGGDRTRIELPIPQEKALRAIQAAGKPVVLVLMTGSAVAVPWAQEHVAAILEAWFPGQAGGAAVADILLGKANPSGRLPVTFYRRTSDLPAFTDYRMQERTYRYFSGQPLYPFGYGLSYTRFRYGALAVTAAAGGGPALTASVQITNEGDCEGDEVVQLYATEPAGPWRRARESLCGFARVHLAPGQSARVTIAVPPAALRRWNPDRQRMADPEGEWTFAAGSSSADLRQRVKISL